MEQMMLFNLEDEVTTPAAPLSEKGIDKAVTNSNKEVHAVPEIGEEVKIKLPNNTDSETYQYLKYYYAHLINKRGIVKEVKLYPSGNYSCTVEYGDEQLILNPENLIILY